MITCSERVGLFLSYKKILFKKTTLENGKCSRIVRKTLDNVREHFLNFFPTFSPKFFRTFSQLFRKIWGNDLLQVQKVPKLGNVKQWVIISETTAFKSVLLEAVKVNKIEPGLIDTHLTGNNSFEHYRKNKSSFQMSLMSRSNLIVYRYRS